MGEGSAVIPISETSQVSSEVKGMAAQQTNELVEKGLDPGEGRPAQLVLCVGGGAGGLCSGYSVLSLSLPLSWAHT